jgi:hypothetical protein
MGVKRPDLVIAAAIIVCLPMAPGIISGGIDPTTALIRFLIALVVCSVGAAILERVWQGYADQARRAAILRQFGPGSATGPSTATRGQDVHGSPDGSQGHP